MDFWDSYGASFANAVRKKKEIDRFIRQFQHYTLEQLEEIRTEGSSYSQVERLAADKLLRESNLQ